MLPTATRLTTEWNQLAADPAVAAATASWAAREPALAGLTTPATVLARLAPGVLTHDQKDEILLALLRLLAAGDQNAGRVLLQTMLPGLVRLARRGPSPEDRLNQAVAELWDVAAHYPLGTRPHRVAANLLGDTLHRLHRDRRPPTAPTGHYPDAAYTIPANEPSPAFGDDARTVIAAAYRDGHLTDRDVEALTATYLADRTGSAEAAQSLGITPAALRKRASRAVSRIRQVRHLYADLLSTSPAWPPAA